MDEDRAGLRLCARHDLTLVYSFRWAPYRIHGADRRAHARSALCTERMVHFISHSPSALRDIASTLPSSRAAQVGRWAAAKTGRAALLNSQSCLPRPGCFSLSPILFRKAFFFLFSTNADGLAEALRGLRAVITYLKRKNNIPRKDFDLAPRCEHFSQIA